MIMKWLGLNDLAETVADMASYTSQLPAAEEINKLLERVEELESQVAALEVQIEGMEEPDMSDYVREDEVEDRIETYCNDNEIPCGDWLSSELQDKVQEAVEEMKEKIKEEIKLSLKKKKPKPKIEKQ